MQKIVRTAAPSGIDFSKGWADFSQEEKNQIRDALLEMTGGRCAYTGKILDDSLAIIDHFNPEGIEDSNDWNNLFVINPITEQLKSNKYDELLIRPDEADYEFDKYFDIDFDKYLIIPNPKANSYDKERAITSINILGLNHGSIVLDRRREHDEFLSVVKQDLEKIFKDAKARNSNTINANVDTSDFSYDFFLDGSLKRLKIPNNDHVDSIDITRYFCVKNLKIENLKNRREIYFLGENGDGKTILLQAIILALKGLSPEFIYKYISTNYNNFSIEIKGENQNTFVYNGYINAVHTDAYAYGVGRLRNHREYDDGGYLTLFDYDTYLTNPVEWFKEVERLENRGIGKLKLDTVKSLFKQLLENKVEIEDTSEGDYIFKEKNTTLEFHQLSDGYRSVLIWLSDLLSRLAKSQPEVEHLKDYKAVVLVDEIGSFLHPRWEYSIVGKLRKLFPKIQWFFTTHSPIIALGASEDAVFYKLYKEDGITKVSEPFHAESFDTRMLSSFVTSPLFNLPTARPASFKGNEYDLETGDYLYTLIHKEVKKRMGNKPLQDTEIQDMISELLEEFENTGKI